MVSGLKGPPGTPGVGRPGNPGPRGRQGIQGKLIYDIPNMRRQNQNEPTGLGLSNQVGECSERKSEAFRSLYDN